MNALMPINARMTATPFPFQIYQQPDRVIFIYEGGAHVWRVIYTDGRAHSKDLNPTYLGESIGHWEGDTLVVDVIGFNDRTWLDQDGHPHTEKLHVIERYTRVNELTLRYEFTVTPPRNRSVQLNGAAALANHRAPALGSEAGEADLVVSLRQQWH